MSEPSRDPGRAGSAPGARVSVVIPAYNSARTVGRAVTSVLGQTCQPAEIVVVDDGSTDDIASALAPFGERVVLVSQRNGGAASARNLGVETARADWVAFLDADDVWAPAKLERQWAVVRRHPEVKVVASRCNVRERGREDSPAPLSPAVPTDRVVNPAEALSLASEVVAALATSAVLARRELLSALRFDESLRTAEDRDLWIRMIASSPVYILSEPLATRVLQPGSLSRSGADLDFPNMLRVVRRHADLLGAAAARRWEANIYRSWAWGRLSEGRTGAAIRPAGRHVLLRPGSLAAWYLLLKAVAWSLKPGPGAGRPG